MISYIFSLRPWDICLILMFSVFSVGITAGLIIVSREELRIAACKRICRWTVSLQNWLKIWQEDIPYEPWMDYQNWKETRP